VNSELRNPKGGGEATASDSDFGLRASFGIRNSEFGLPAGGRPIRLHIERLVLDGFPLEAGAAARVQAALETELARRLAACGVAQEFQVGGAVPAVRGGELHWAPGLGPSNLGSCIAQAIHAAIGGRAVAQTTTSDASCPSS
jgi:hypothetical protein